MNIVPVAVREWYGQLTPTQKKIAGYSAIAAGTVAVVATGGAVAYAIAGSEALVIVTGAGTVATGKAAVELAKRIRV
jgi:hypothetical protein